MSRRGMQRLTARFVPVQDSVPDILRRISKPEQIPILRIDGTFIDQEIDVDCPTPIRLAYQHDRYRGLILRVCTRVSTSNSSSNVP
jgi:hypothetical protein